MPPLRRRCASVSSTRRPSGMNGISRQRQYQIRHMSAGLCYECSRPAAHGTLFCELHRRKRNLENRERLRKIFKRKIRYYKAESYRFRKSKAYEHVFGAFGVHWKIDSADSGRRFSVVYHPIAPRSLVAPLHRHHREDEYSYVLTGKLGALLGEEVMTAGPGTWVFQPRGQWHTFWNAGDTPCEIIEVISPGGFEDFFRELTTVWGNPEHMSALGAKYELDFDFESVPKLCERFGLKMSKIAN
jgi:mannose-6-phosphate isomerase-like protein (cupin superfamily)